MPAERPATASIDTGSTQRRRAITHSTSRFTCSICLSAVGATRGGASWVQALTNVIDSSQASTVPKATRLPSSR